MGGAEAETSPINRTMKARGEGLGWLEGGGAETIWFAASLYPGGKDSVEKGKSRIRFEK